MKVIGISKNFKARKGMSKFKKNHSISKLKNSGKIKFVTFKKCACNRDIFF